MKEFYELGTAIERVSRPDDQQRQVRLDAYRKALQEAEAKREESEEDA